MGEERKNNSEHSKIPALGTLLQIVMVLLALGVAYGALKNEQETMKANQITMKVTQERILDQLNAIESRLIRIESIMGSDLNTAGGRHRK